MIFELIFNELRQSLVFSKITARSQSKTHGPRSSKIWLKLLEMVQIYSTPFALFISYLRSINCLLPLQSHADEQLQHKEGLGESNYWSSHWFTATLVGCTPISYWLVLVSMTVLDWNLINEFYLWFLSTNSLELNVPWWCIFVTYNRKLCTLCADHAYFFFECQIMFPLDFYWCHNW